MKSPACVVALILFRVYVLGDKVFFPPIVGDDCLTPAKERGKCVYIRNCSHYFNLLHNATKPIPIQTLDYLNAAKCGDTVEEKPLLCCPENGILLVLGEEVKRNNTPKISCEKNFNNEEIQRLLSSKDEQIASKDKETASKDKEIKRLRLLLSEAKGYEKIPGVGSYKYHKDSVQFETASEACQNEGAHLFIINSNEEEDTIKKINSKNGNHAIWTGIVKRKSEYVTIFGTPLSETGYSKWQSGEPNNNSGNEFCVDFEYHHGGLNDLPCDHTRPFICEVDL